MPPPRRIPKKELSLTMKRESKLNTQVATGKTTRPPAASSSSCTSFGCGWQLRDHDPGLLRGGVHGAVRLGPVSRQGLDAPDAPQARLHAERRHGLEVGLGPAGHQLHQEE